MPADCPLVLPSPAATQTLAEILGRLAPANTVLLLEGNLGGGKTTFVQGLGRGLGIEDAILSPTFALVQEYWEGRLPLFHCDLYRLSQGTTDDLDLEQMWESGGVSAIEWPDRLSFLPEDYLRLTFTVTGDEERQLAIDSRGDRNRQLWQDAIARFKSECRSS